LKYFKTFEDLHESVVKTFKSYMQDVSKIICVMQKMREDYTIALLIHFAKGFGNYLSEKL
jgi:hypothetical protein